MEAMIAFLVCVWEKRYGNKEEVMALVLGRPAPVITEAVSPTSIVEVQSFFDGSCPNAVGSYSNPSSYFWGQSSSVFFIII